MFFMVWRLLVMLKTSSALHILSFHVMASTTPRCSASCVVASLRDPGMLTKTSPSPICFSGTTLRVTHSGSSQGSAGLSSFHFAFAFAGRQSRSFRHSIGNFPLCTDVGMYRPDIFPHHLSPPPSTL